MWWASHVMGAISICSKRFGDPTLRGAWHVSIRAAGGGCSFEVQRDCASSERRTGEVPHRRPGSSAAACAALRLYPMPRVWRRARVAVWHSRLAA